MSAFLDNVCADAEDARSVCSATCSAVTPPPLPSTNHSTATNNNIYDASATRCGPCDQYYVHEQFVYFRENCGQSMVLIYTVLVFVACVTGILYAMVYHMYVNSLTMQKRQIAFRTMIGLTMLEFASLSTVINSGTSLYFFVPWFVGHALIYMSHMESIVYSIKLPSSDPNSTHIGDMCAAGRLILIRGGIRSNGGMYFTNLVGLVLMTYNFVSLDYRHDEAIRQNATYVSTLVVREANFMTSWILASYGLAAMVCGVYVCFMSRWAHQLETLWLEQHQRQRPPFVLCEQGNFGGSDRSNSPFTTPSRRLLTLGLHMLVFGLALVSFTSAGSAGKLNIGDGQVIWIVLSIHPLYLVDNIRCIHRSQRSAPISTDIERGSESANNDNNEGNALDIGGRSNRPSSVSVHSDSSDKKESEISTIDLEIQTECPPPPLPPLHGKQPQVKKNRDGAGHSERTTAAPIEVQTILVAKVDRNQTLAVEDTSNVKNNTNAIVVCHNRHHDDNDLLKAEGLDAWKYKVVM